MSKFFKLFPMLAFAVVVTALSACSSPKSADKSNISLASAGSALTKYEAEDYYFNWKSKSYQSIDLDKGSAEITKSGIYAVTGTLKDGSLVIDVNKDQDKGIVYIVLNNASISSTTSAPIYVKEAEKAVILLENSSKNTLYQGSGSVVDNNGDPSAAIFSKSDLTITGSGTLNVTSDYNDGITSKDDLLITDGTLIIKTKSDGITGKDLLSIDKANITINAGKDALRATNETDAGMGSILITGGSFTINAKDDAIHGISNITINGGSIDIKACYEGIEAKTITINDGKISLISSDDSFNVNNGTGLLTINGGEVYLNSEGDGVDSNGSVKMTGGIVFVDGPAANNNGAIDYDGSFNISGGTIIAAGSSGMAQSPDESSGQPSLLMYYSSVQAAGTKIIVRDSSGKEVAAFAPSKQFTSAAISAPGLKTGSSYTIFHNDKAIVTFTLTDTVTYLNESGITTNMSRGPGNMGPGGKTGPGGMPPGGERQPGNRKEQF